MWNELVNQNDIAALLEIFGYFRDSCIKELKYISGAFVNADLSMSPINSKRILRIIFQRQYRDPMVIEIEFVGLSELTLSPANENFTCELQGASMFINDSKIYWYDCDAIENPIEKYDGTWVYANKARWRIADDYIGNKEIY